MSNERTANGGRLTRAMHRAAAAIYAATVLGGGSDSGIGTGLSEQAIQVTEVEGNSVLPDVSQERHDEGSGVGASEGDVQGQSEGSTDLSGETSG